MINLRNPLWGVLAFAGAAGGPYVYYNTDLSSPGNDPSTAVSQEGSNTTVPGGQLVSHADSGWPAPINNTVSDLVDQARDDGLSEANGQPILANNSEVQSFSQILRFDISPNWLPEHFSRVSRVHGAPGLEGARVSLVTGTSPSDIAGTLTYYFDMYQRVQRITLHGITGDPSRFLADLQQNYGMNQQPALGGLLYTLTWNGSATSVAFAEPAAVISSDSLYGRYSVFIELNQPGLAYGLSDSARQLLANGQSANRW